MVLALGGEPQRTWPLEHIKSGEGSGQRLVLKSKQVQLRSFY